METNDLIEQLAKNVVPVRPLPAPMTRAMLWLTMSLLYVAGFALVYNASGSEISLSLDTSFLIQQLAIITTAATAAIAAFCCVVPGRDRRIAVLPVLPLAVWLVSLAEEGANTWLRAGAAGLDLRVGWDCVPQSGLLAFGPAIAIALMLRRGAPLYPRSALVLGTLAASALGNLGLRLFNVGNVSAVTVVWHIGASLLLLGLAWCLGTRVLSSNHTPMR